MKIISSLRKFRRHITFAGSVAVLTALPTSNSAQELADTAGYSKYRFGGYGEIVANFKDYGINRFQKEGSTRERRNTISIPRVSLGFDYKFTSKWLFGIEVEFESGGTGAAYELENKENGEYEMEVEKAGEVEIEQLHLTRLIIPAFNVRAGHLIIPLGITNTHHEPILFFGSSRPEAETALLPSTWHETGLQVFGTFGKNHSLFDYQLLITAGLNANGFTRDHWIKDGKQGFFETDNFTCPAFSGRIDYRGVKGLRIGLSGYYCYNTGANSDKSQTYASYGRIPLSMIDLDAQFVNRYVTLRGNLLYGHLGNSAALDDRNGRLPGASPYSRMTPIAKNAISYGIEAGLNLAGLIRSRRAPALYPYLRYEYLNPQLRVAAGSTPDRRLEVSKWSFGLNWSPIRQIVVKFDYASRRIGTSSPFAKGEYNSENEFGLGIAYIGWFLKN